MPTKQELEQKIIELEWRLEEEQEVPRGHTIQNCHIDMGNDEAAVAIAEAASEGMKALQTISKRSNYGIYLGG